MTGNPRMFTTLDEEVDGQERITFGDNSKVKVQGLGKVAISNDHSISNVLYVIEFQLAIHWSLLIYQEGSGCVKER